ncbi:MAG: hypothetical protein ACPGFA_11270 [Pikeienuella sp.]
MTGRVLGIAMAAMLTILALYLSRFWPFEWWGRDGLLDIKDLRPQGDLLRLWLRGTPFAAYDLLIWAIGCFAVLTGIQNLWNKVFSH